MKLKELKELWEKLGNVPVSEIDEIDEDFYIWEKGTSKLHIWYWFEERLSDDDAMEFLNIQLQKKRNNNFDN